ncbi:MAG TPA: hypothetical protein VFX22_01100, partial [Candidatus Kapabacteria bacterium]|nr:hypothetical protein [Candidatus Kapabacteria bacterium]
MSLIFQSLRSQTAIAFACVFAFSSTHSLLARPAKYNHAKGDEQLTFLRQVNTKSNVEFYFTNRGVLFNAGPANGEDGLFWPRGSEDSYIYGEGLWFAAKKKLIDGK